MSMKFEKGAERTTKTRQLFTCGLLAVLSMSAVADDVAADSELRQSESVHYTEGGRLNNRNPDKGVLSVDQYSPLKSVGERSKRVAKTDSGKTSAAKTSGSASQSSTHDFWIFEADVELFYDDDGDGYFYGVDLLFDADTIYSSAEVYAAVYLSLEGGPWNEYAVTEDFTILGANGGDEYVLVTELMSGYPTGEYDLLIELFDSFDGAFLTSFGPEDTSELAYLPLEDFGRDAPLVERRVAISHGGGGSTGIWTLLLLGAGLAARLRRRLC